MELSATPRAALPTGTVTFLFTDVEGSTRLWEHYPDEMRDALTRHDAIVESLTERHHGQVVRPRGEGDSRFCVFARASDAVAAAAAVQRALQAGPWPAEARLRVRQALHTGEADLRDGDYSTMGATSTVARACGASRMAGKCCSHRPRSTSRAIRCRPTSL